MSAVVSRWLPQRSIAGFLGMWCLHGVSLAATVSALATAGGTGLIRLDQQASTATPGVTVTANGSTQIDILDGCTAPVWQDNQAASRAMATADFGQLSIFAQAEYDFAFLRHGGPPPGTCDFSSTTVPTRAGASASFSDELMVRSTGGVESSTVEVTVRGYWDALLTGLTERDRSRPDFQASVTMAGTSIVNDNTADTANVRTLLADGSYRYGRAFEQTVVVNVNELFNLDFRFNGGLALSTLICGLGACDDRIVTFDGDSTGQISEFLLPVGFELVSTSGQIANYGDRYAYVAVAGAPDPDPGQVPEPGSLALVATSLFVLLVRRTRSSRNRRL